MLTFIEIKAFGTLKLLIKESILAGHGVPHI
jgi:hypothetical protein